ncbi:hypothetical protein Tco_1463409 [Tanacetum coccineum]
MRDVVSSKTERELVRIKIDDGNAFWNEIEVKTGNSKVNTARYALTENPTIYVSLIKEIELTATIDGKVKIVTEASVRRHIQLADYDGISSLPTTEIFEQLSLMGYVSTFDKLTFQKGQVSP